MTCLYLPDILWYFYICQIFHDISIFARKGFLHFRTFVYKLQKRVPSYHLIQKFQRTICFSNSSLNFCWRSWSLRSSAFLFFLQIMTVSIFSSRLHNCKNMMYEGLCGPSGRWSLLVTSSFAPIMLCFSLKYIILYCIVIYHMLYCIVRFCIPLYHMIQWYSITLHGVVLYCTVLHCNISLLSYGIQFYCTLLRFWFRRAGCVSQDAYLLHFRHPEKVKCICESQEFHQFWGFCSKNATWETNLNYKS